MSRHPIPARLAAIAAREDRAEMRDHLTIGGVVYRTASPVPVIVSPFTRRALAGELPAKEVGR